MKLKQKLLVYQAIFWLCYTSLAILAFGLGAGVGIGNAIVETTISYALSILIFYVHLFVLKQTLDQRKWLLYVCLLPAVLALNIFAKYSVYNWLWEPIFSHQSSVSSMPLLRQSITFSWQGLTFIIFSAGYWFALNRIKAERIKQASQILELENAALRAKINPHFFVNSMNHFKVMTEEKLPAVADGIDAMITFYRSSITHTNGEGKIPLFSEIGAVEALVTIFESRFPYADVVYENTVTANADIIPHVLATFTENALKHGRRTSEGDVIYIHLSQEGKDLVFKTKNKKSNRPKDGSHGIGMTYIKRQLENAYVGRYSLQINESKEDYEVYLTITNLFEHELAAENKYLYN